MPALEESWVPVMPAAAASCEPVMAAVAEISPATMVPFRISLVVIAPVAMAPVPYW